MGDKIKVGLDKKKTDELKSQQEFLAEVMFLLLRKRQKYYKQPQLVGKTRKNNRWITKSN